MDEDKRIPYFFLGVGIGVAIGILFAPKSGEETRGLIRAKADESKDFLKRKTGDLREQAVEAVDKGKSLLQRQKEQFSAAVDAGKQAYRESIQDDAGLTAD
ncbi:MAG: YtxH domain-containing protein [Acidobacteriota bacterium]|jgi:gas vesicle protein|nr:YtxH domain-containing protein [Bryobacteraceae bacterium CoA2 C42]